MKYQNICALLVLTVLLSGCSTFSRKKETTDSVYLEPQVIARFDDIPVPMGFKLIPRDSYVYESDGIRVGILKYQGKSNPDFVVNFFKEQLPMFNWRLLNVVEYGRRLLNFDRENETCVITLDSKGKTLFLTITVGPKSKGVKKQNSPIK